MLRFRFAACILGGFIILPIQIIAQTAVKPMPTGTATVSGRVVLKGEPARGVTVGLQGQQPNSPPSSTLRATTDENGRFRITSLPAGRYSVMALAPGYITSGDSDFGPRGKIVNVAEGENVENIDIELKRGGVVTGRVIDSTGRPIADERIALHRLDKNGRAQRFSEFALGGGYEMFMTDDRGIYRLYGLPEDRYLVSVGFAQAPGSITVTSNRMFYPRTFHPDAVNESEAKVVELNEGSESTGIDIRVAEAKKAHDIFGRVVNADTGQPVAGVEISYGSMGSEGNRITSWGSNGERSKANGEFHLIGVLPGKYGVFAGSRNDNEFVSDPVMCDVTEGDVTGIEIKVRQGASIRGIVAIEGGSDPKPQLNLSQIRFITFMRPNPGDPPSPPSNMSINVNADGSFQVRGLSQGKVQIQMMGMPIRGLSLARIEHNGVMQREGIEVKSGEQVSGVRLVLAYGTLTLRGEVKLVGGVLPTGQRLMAAARRTDQQIQIYSSAEVDVRGQFVIENLVPGEYEVTVNPIFTPNSERMDRQILDAFRSTREKVVVSTNNQPAITIVIDFNRK